VNSNERSDRQPLNLGEHVPTTAQDIDVLGRLQRETPSWLLLSSDEIDAMLPADALDRRMPTSPGARPFTLP
jgi:hypothetical protein